jgi:hypothetical protein
LKRTLALELLRLDELEEAFRDKAIVDRDVAAGVLLVKVAERRATLLGMNAPIGHAVQVIQHDPPNKPTSTERIAAPVHFPATASSRPMRVSMCFGCMGSKRSSRGRQRSCGGVRKVASSPAIRPIF